MARLQILELPTIYVGDATETPFALVIDQADEDTFQHLVYGTALDADGNQRSTHESLKDQLGARAILAFEDTIDIPANDASAYLAESETQAEPPRANVRAIQAEEKLKAFMEQQYAIDQDRKADLARTLGMNRLRDWDDIRNAAAGVRRDRDAYAAAIERVRRLHQPVEHRGQTICWECSNYDFPGQSTDTPPVAYDQCRTLQAITGEPDTPGEEVGGE